MGEPGSIILRSLPGSLASLECPEWAALPKQEGKGEQMEWLARGADRQTITNRGGPFADHEKRVSPTTQLHPSWSSPWHLLHALLGQENLPGCWESTLYSSISERNLNLFSQLFRHYLESDSHSMPAPSLCPLEFLLTRETRLTHTVIQPSLCVLPN